MDYNSSQKKTGFSLLKLFGLLIAAAGLIYKIIFAVKYHYYIADWWSGFLIMYYLMYLTSIFTIASSFFKGTASLITSIVIMAVSCLLLCADGISLLGFAASLNSTPMIKMGIVPLVNVLNLVSGVLYLVAWIRSRHVNS